MDFEIVGKPGEPKSSAIAVPNQTDPNRTNIHILGRVHITYVGQTWNKEGDEITVITIEPEE